MNILLLQTKLEELLVEGKNIPWFDITTKNNIGCLRTNLSFPHSLHRQWWCIWTLHLLHPQFFMILLHTLFLLHFARSFTMELVWNQPKGFLRSQLKNKQKTNQSRASDIRLQFENWKWMIRTLVKNGFETIANFKVQCHKSYNSWAWKPTQFMHRHAKQIFRPNDMVFL